MELYISVECLYIPLDPTGCAVHQNLGIVLGHNLGLKMRLFLIFPLLLVVVALLPCRLTRAKAISVPKATSWRP